VREREEKRGREEKKRGVGRCDSAIVTVHIQCTRCHDIIKPSISGLWFVMTDGLHSAGNLMEDRERERDEA
jgi:hypothetical protein